MKLYYSPGACSLAVHLVANEAAVPLDLVRVDLATKKTEAGDDFLAVNPNGYVPTLLTADGDSLTEAQILVQFIADQKPESGLMPAFGSIDRYRAQRWLAFISSELHKGFSPLFKPGTSEDAKAAAREHLAKRFAYLDAHLADNEYLLGDTFTAADAYLWTVLGWTRFVNVDTSSYKNIERFMGAVATRPAVQKTLQEEGLA
ncbi:MULTISPECIES: glutathione transferase GstA [unclassified Aminobacter]|uniref:glutathione transferase GstA n=1 Tax=unclassified Aminobacter TaxID=2644704 RepID=UPI000465FCB4|nr:MULTISPECIES: glutathione transferase GstA [unclassified Aminobacter]TWH24468.1 glutathione S-transferase [Aminobacter sp. J15]